MQHKMLSDEFGVFDSDTRDFLHSLILMIYATGMEISAESEGEGKGITYWLRIPTKRQSSNVLPLTQDECAAIFGEFVNYRGH